MFIVARDDTISMEHETVILTSDVWDEVVLRLKHTAANLEREGSRSKDNPDVQGILRSNANRVLAIALEIDRQRSALDPVASRKA